MMNSRQFGGLAGRAHVRVHAHKVHAEQQRTLGKRQLGGIGDIEDDDDEDKGRPGKEDWWTILFPSGMYLRHPIFMG